MHRIYLLSSVFLLGAACSDPTTQRDGGDGAGGELAAAISDGTGRKVSGGTGTCTPTEDRYLEGDVGVVTARDGRTFTVPLAPADGVTCTDLHNPCNRGQNPDWSAQAQTIVLDNGPNAVEVTAYLYADNYFELYVNGRYLCKDALRFVPFNAHVVRFRASYPMTIGIKAADWEESLGVGVEQSTRIGDAGIIARFVDSEGRSFGTGTAWRCQPQYIAPLDDPSCVRSGGDSAACGTAPTCPRDGQVGDCHAVHYPLPATWAAQGFDDSGWQTAVRYGAAEVGPKTAYTMNAALFQGAEFIWTRNLFLDNLVLCRFIAP